MSEVVIYQSGSEQAFVEVKLDKETVWLNQEQLTTLFKRDRTVIGRHIRNVFKEGELQEKEVCANFAHTTPHGAQNRKTYNHASKCGLKTTLLQQFEKGEELKKRIVENFERL